LKKTKIISLIVLGTSLAGIIAPVAVNAKTVIIAGNPVEIPEDIQNKIDEAISENKQEQIDLDFSDATKKALAQLDTIIQIAEKSSTQKTVDDAIKAFTSFDLTIQDLKAHKDMDEFDKDYFRIVECIKKMPTDIRNKEFIAFDKALVEGWYNIFTGKYHGGATQYCLNSFYNSYVNYMKEHNDIPEIQKDLDDIYIDMMNRINKPNVDTPMLPPDAGKEDKPLPGLEGVDTSPLTTPATDIPAFDGISSTVRYVNEDGVVYKITEYYDQDGKLVKTVKELAPKEDWILAGVTTYENFGGGTSSMSSHVSANQWNYINENQNPESNLTVQYCINKDSDSPYYYDTGIRASLDGKISYEQLRDVLYQVSVKSGGWFTEDNDKLLAIIEGKPVLAKNTKKVYTMEDMNLLFSNFKKVDVKILETRIGKSQSMDDTAISTDAKNIKIDDKDIQLVTTPLIKDARVLLPVQQLATEMGATVKTEGNKYIITRTLAIWRTVKGERKIVGHVKDTIVYEMNKNYVIVNGQMIQMGTNPDMKDGNFMAEVQEMAKALGYKLTWDTETGTLIFKS
jgi:Copper amine oxidase N-terminal domain.